jgi:hypothetical protein
MSSLSSGGGARAPLRSAAPPPASRFQAGCDAMRPGQSGQDVLSW